MAYEISGEIRYMDDRKGLNIFFAGSISRGKAVAINNFSLAL